MVINSQLCQTVTLLVQSYIKAEGKLCGVIISPKRQTTSAIIKDKSEGKPGGLLVLETCVAK